jgi:hypothetical protein
MVSRDGASIESFIPFCRFDAPPLPTDVDAYLLYKAKLTAFIVARNERIAKHTGQADRLIQTTSCRRTAYAASAKALMKCPSWNLHLTPIKRFFPGPAIGSTRE